MPIACSGARVLVLLAAGVSAGCCCQQPPPPNVPPPHPPEPSVATCAQFDTITAAIAARTVECRGTIGPTLFEVKSGYLIRTFAECKTQDSQPIKEIDTLLALQESRHPKLREFRSCVTERWTDWSELFAKTELTTCPSWQRSEVIGKPSRETLAQLDRMQPRLPDAADALKLCAQAEPAERQQCVSRQLQAALSRDATLTREQRFAEILVAPKTSATYSIAYEPACPTCKCSDVAVCAAQCSAGLPGFVVSASGTRVVADPTYWLYDDPPMTYGPPYVHPMSRYLGPPGALYGHVNRVGESCTRWDPIGRLHFKTVLQQEDIGGVLGTVSLSRCGDL